MVQECKTKEFQSSYQWSTSAPCHSDRFCIQGATCSGILLPFQNKDCIIAGNKLLDLEGMTCDILKAIKEYLATPLSSNYDMVTSRRNWLPKILPASSIYLSWSKKLFYPSLLNVLLTSLILIHNSQLLSVINEATAVPWGIFWGMKQSAQCNIIMLP